MELWSNPLEAKEGEKYNELMKYNKKYKESQQRYSHEWGL